MPAETPALEVVGMRKRFGALEVLKGVSLTANDGDTGDIVNTVTPSTLSFDMVYPLLGVKTNPVAWVLTLSGIPSWTVGICSTAVPLLLKVMVSLRIPAPKSLILYSCVRDI